MMPENSSESEGVDFFRKSEGLRKLGNDIFELDSAVETILRAMEQDVNNAVNSGEIPKGTGQIVVRIDKVGEEDYNLLIKSNGSGLTPQEFQVVVSNIGGSSAPLAGNSSPGEIEGRLGFWAIALFQFSPNYYKIKSNPRNSDDSFAGLFKTEGFEFTEDTNYKFFGTKMELTVEDTSYTVPNIGKKFRQVAKRELDVEVRYELFKNGKAKNQSYINVS